MYVHDMSPFIWQFSEDFGVRWYGFSYMLGFVLAFFIIRWMTLRQRAGFTTQMVVDFVTVCAVGTLLGGRLGYCLFYAPDLLIKFKTEFPFWGGFALSEGGMSSHGGMIGLVMAATAFAIRTGVSRLYLYDLVALAGSLGVFFGRIANFINGELLGRVAEEGFPFAVKFPTEIYQWPADKPQRLASLTEIIHQIPGYSRDQWQNWLAHFQTNDESRIAINEALVRIVQTVQEGNSTIKNALAPLLSARYPSQLFAAVGEGLFIFLFLLLLWFRPRRPGVIGATFLVLYSVIRIVDEQYRQPDIFLGPQWLNLTRGQWLSILMLLIGMALLFVWSRRETLPTSGWGRGQSVKLHRR